MSTTIFTQASEGTGISLESVTPMDEARAIYNAAYDRYMARKLKLEPIWDEKHFFQSLGRVARFQPKLVYHAEPTITEKDIGHILDRKLQALGNLAENRESFLDLEAHLRNIKPEPASVIWGKRPNMKRPTNKELSASLACARELNDVLRRDYRELKDLHAVTCRELDKRWQQVTRLEAEIKNLRQQLVCTARAAAELAHTVEHHHKNA